MRYSATSVMLPDLDLLEQAALLQRLGYDGIEWRVRRVSDEVRARGYSNWGAHKNDLTPDNFLANAPVMKQVAADHGLAIAGIASNVAATDLEQVKLLVEGAAGCGAPFIRVGASQHYDGSVNYHVIYEETVAAYGQALDATAGSGVRFALEIHGGTIHVSASLAHRILSHFPSERVCAIYDPNNLVADGWETTELALDLLGDYAGHCHFGAHRPVERERDAQGTMRWGWESCALADGLFDFARLLRKLKAIGYAKFISVEDFRDLPHEHKLKEGIEYLRAVEAAR